MHDVNRLHTANTSFVCAAGPMSDGEHMINATRAAVALARQQGIDATYLDLTGAPTDGCFGHPGITGHSQIAKKLLEALRHRHPLCEQPSSAKIPKMPACCDVESRRIDYFAMPVAAIDGERGRVR